MKEIKKVCSEKVILYSPLAVISLLSMSIGHKENAHGYLKLEAVMQEMENSSVLANSYVKERIRIYYADNEKEELLFNGRIERVVFRKEKHVLSAQIYGISDTVILDQEKKKRSFQNVQMSYQEIADHVTDAAGARFIWDVANKSINSPLIQYEETDWEFLMRLASHFHTALIPELTTGQADFWFGMRNGKQREITGGRVLESGFSEKYYKDGGYEKGDARNSSLYMKVKHNKIWNMGDFVLYESHSYTVYQREAVFGEGELCFFYTLGTEGMLYKKKQYQEHLNGLELMGTVKKTKQESVYLGLDIDSGCGADYAWPWVPETGNISYCMPEVGMRVFLYMPTNEEKEGLAVHGIRENGIGGFYDNVQNREFLTAHGKKAGMYPSELLMEAKNGVSSFSMEDNSGIEVKSEGKIQIQANDGIYVNGSDISVTAPQELLCQTDRSNIDICKNFNLYAPGGVKSKGMDKVVSIGNVRENIAGNTSGNTKKPEHWETSYAALGAIPVTEFASMKRDSLIDMAAKGTVAKLAKGSTAIAVKEVMDGKPSEKTTFSGAFQAMGSFTVKGAHSVPFIMNDNSGTAVKNEGKMETQTSNKSYPEAK